MATPACIDECVARDLVRGALSAEAAMGLAQHLQERATFVALIAAFHAVFLGAARI